MSIRLTCMIGDIHPIDQTLLLSFKFLMTWRSQSGCNIRYGYQRYGWIWFKCISSGLDQLLQRFCIKHQIFRESFIKQYVFMNKIVLSLGTADLPYDGDHQHIVLYVHQRIQFEVRVWHNNKGIFQMNKRMQLWINSSINGRIILIITQHN